MLGWALKHLVLWGVIGGIAWMAISGRLPMPDRDTAQRLVEDGRRAQAAEDNTGGGRSLVIRAGHGGHFWVNAEVDGATVTFVIDTGATGVVLSKEDGERLGFRLSARDYTAIANTAGGQVRTAPVTLNEVRVGALSLRNVDATVNPRLSGISLLGMSFLSRLDGYEVQGDKLKLYW